MAGTIQTPTMRAIHIPSFMVPSASYSTLQPTSLPRLIPQANELLIRITHTSPQQVDLLYARGRHQNNNAKRGHVHPPFVLGLDFAGIVFSSPIGSDFRPGDRVMGSQLGAFAEYICATPAQVKRVPSGLSNADAAALVGGAVSYGAVVEVAKVRKGETVLVSGAPGGLGVVACQVAKAVGAKVVALVSSRDRVESLNRVLDVELVVSADTAWSGEVMKWTQGKGINAVIDNAGVVEESLRCLAYNGRIVLVGFAGRGGVMESIAMNKILLIGAHVIGYVRRILWYYSVAAN